MNNARIYLLDQKLEGTPDLWSPKSKSWEGPVPPSLQGGCAYVCALLYSRHSPVLSPHFHLDPDL